MGTNEKEEVKNRMLRKAAELWNVPANEINDSFDPLVNFLIAAFASEIEQLSGDINSAQTNITERLIQLLTPETVFDSKPAHSIAYAESLEPTTKISPDYSFYHKKKDLQQNASHNFKNLFFSPTQETTLVAAKIKYMITGNKCYELSTQKSKNLFEVFEEKPSLPSSVLYFAIESDLDTVPLDLVSIYFEYQGVENKELFYYHLRNAKWYVDNKPIEVIDGYWNSDEVDSINLDTIFGGVPTKTNSLVNEVNNFYEKFYVTLNSQKGIPLKASFPEIESLLERNTSKVEKDLRWIKVEFPTVINTSVLGKLFCSFNTFPVINRKKESFSYQMKKFISIIPVVSESLFLDIKSVTNSKGDAYKLQNTSTEESDKGTYYLRNYNVGKLDSRKAKEYLQHLLELLKSESAAFSLFGHNFLESKIGILNQTISILENKVSEVSQQSVYTNYISLKLYSEVENILVDYWVTNGTEANHLKAGKELQIYEGIDLNQTNSYLVLPTFGGQDKLSMEQRLSAYRRSALSKSRIITEEDVKALCFDLYDNKIEKVAVRRGFTKDMALKKGLIQCIEVAITPKAETKMEPSEWEYLNENLLSILKKQSINIFPYKVVINNSKESVLN